MNAATNPARLSKAFDLVCPAKHAAALARAGLIRDIDAARVDWKNPIARAITAAEIARAGVTVAEIGEAVAFYTATVAKIIPAEVLPARWHDVPSAEIGKAQPGFLIMADGYRAGPAGDH